MMMRTLVGLGDTGRGDERRPSATENVIAPAPNQL